MSYKSNDDKLSNHNPLLRVPFIPKCNALFNIFVTYARLTPICLARSALVQLLAIINSIYRFLLSVFVSLILAEGGCFTS